MRGDLEWGTIPGLVRAAAERYGVELDTEAWTRPTSVVEPDAERVAYYAKGHEEHLARLTAARHRARD